MIHFILKGICDFLLVISSNLGFISHHFRDTATCSLKLFSKKCGQTAADGNMVTTDSLQKIAVVLSNGTIADSL